jgi:hypothetical protein
VSCANAVIISSAWSGMRPNDVLTRERAGSGAGRAAPAVVAFQPDLGLTLRGMPGIELVRDPVTPRCQ